MDGEFLLGQHKTLHQSMLSEPQKGATYVSHYPRPARPQHDRSWMLNTPAVITRKEKDIFRFLETINKQ